MTSCKSLKLKVKSAFRFELIITVIIVKCISKYIGNYYITLVVV